VSATSLALISTWIAYRYYKTLKERLRKFRKRLEEGRTEGKYYRIEEIHGRREEERRRTRREVERNMPLMGYISTPEGNKLITPLFDMNVEYIPPTSDMVVRMPEYPIRVETTVVEASTPLFRRQLNEAYRRIREFKRRIEE